MDPDEDLRSIFADIPKDLRMNILDKVTIKKFKEAVSKGDVGAVENYIATVELTDAQKMNMILIANVDGHLEIMKMLLDNYDIGNLLSSTFILSAEYGRLPIVKELFQRLGGLSKETGQLSLINAAEHGHKDIVEFLVNTGVDPSALDNEALTKAEAGGHKQVVRYLIFRPEVQKKLKQSRLKQLRKWTFSKSQYWEWDEYFNE